MVRKEYLPADTILTISIQKEGDVEPTVVKEGKLLKPTDLWLPGDPDSPVAEFEEEINVPGGKSYTMIVKATNPAGIESEEAQIIKGFCAQLWREGWYKNTISAAMYSARYSPRQTTPIQKDIISGQHLWKWYWGGYQAALHRTYLSFDTSMIPADKTVMFAKLLMKVGHNNVILHGGAHFDIRVYSGFFGTLDSGDWEACTNYETSKNSSAMPGSEWVEFDISPVSINILGKTQFRICSSREEDNITPLAGGPSTPIFIWDSMEFIHWENEAYLEIQLEQ